VPPASVWTLSENLAWGNGWTPLQIVRAWMASPSHRRKILTPGFREIGIAIVAGARAARFKRAATYATEFGAVHRH
jgi:uncharacterized protein YkwD